MIENDFESIYFSPREGFSFEKSCAYHRSLESQRISLLKSIEDEWCLKSIAIWLKSGGENMEFLHAFAKRRELLNIIWCLQDDQGRKIPYFNGFENLGKQYFENLFKAPLETSIAEVIQIAQFFLRMVDEDECRDLIYEISMEALKVMLHRY